MKIRDSIRIGEINLKKENNKKLMIESFWQKLWLKGRRKKLIRLRKNLNFDYKIQIYEL